MEWFLLFAPLEGRVPVNLNKFYSNTHKFTLSFLCLKSFHLNLKMKCPQNEVQAGLRGSFLILPLSTLGSSFRVHIILHI